MFVKGLNLLISFAVFVEIYKRQELTTGSTQSAILCCKATFIILAYCLRVVRARCSVYHIFVLTMRLKYRFVPSKCEYAIHRFSCYSTTFLSLWNIPTSLPSPKSRLVSLFSSLWDKKSVLLQAVPSSFDFWSQHWGLRKCALQHHLCRIKASLLEIRGTNRRRGWRLYFLIPRRNVLIWSSLEESLWAHLSL